MACHRGPRENIRALERKLGFFTERGLSRSIKAELPDNVRKMVDGIDKIKKGFVGWTPAKIHSSSAFDSAWRDLFWMLGSHLWPEVTTDSASSEHLPDPEYYPRPLVFLDDRLELEQNFSQLVFEKCIMYQRNQDAKPQREKRRTSNLPSNLLPASDTGQVGARPASLQGINGYDVVEDIHSGSQARLGTTPAPSSSGEIEPDDYDSDTTYYHRYKRNPENDSIQRVSSRKRKVPRTYEDSSNPAFSFLNACASPSADLDTRLRVSSSDRSSERPRKRRRFSGDMAREEAGDKLENASTRPVDTEESLVVKLKMPHRQADSPRRTSVDGGTVQVMTARSQRARKCDHASAPMQRTSTAVEGAENDSNKLEARTEPDTTAASGSRRISGDDIARDSDATPAEAIPSTQADGGTRRFRDMMNVLVDADANPKRRAERKTSPSSPAFPSSPQRPGQDVGVIATHSTPQTLSEPAVATSALDDAHAPVRSPAPLSSKAGVMSSDVERGISTSLTETHSNEDSHADDGPLGNTAPPEDFAATVEETSEQPTASTPPVGPAQSPRLALPVDTALSAQSPAVADAKTPSPPAATVQDHAALVSIGGPTAGANAKTPSPPAATVQDHAALVSGGGSTAEAEASVHHKPNSDAKTNVEATQARFGTGQSTQAPSVSIARMSPNMTDGSSTPTGGSGNDTASAARDAKSQISHVKDNTGNLILVDWTDRDDDSVLVPRLTRYKIELWNALKEDMPAIFKGKRIVGSRTGEIEMSAAAVLDQYGESMADEALEDCMEFLMTEAYGKEAFVPRTWRKATVLMSA